MVIVGPYGRCKSTALRRSPDWRRSAPADISIGDRIVKDRAQGPGHRDGVPELRPLPAPQHDRASRTCFGREQRKRPRTRSARRPGVTRSPVTSVILVLENDRTAQRNLYLILAGYDSSGFYFDRQDSLYDHLKVPIYKRN